MVLLPKYNESHAHTRDYGFGSLWDKEDSDYVWSLLRRRDESVFEERIKKIWDDHKLIRDDPRFSPMEVTYKEDLVVAVGLTRNAQLMTGQSTTSYTHFASGTGATAESTTNSIADLTESARVSMATSGDRYASGTSAKFAGFFGSSSPTATITSGVVADSATPSAGTILFYTKYASSLSHVNGSTVYVLQETIAQTAS